MVEITKDFIRFVIGVIILLLIFSVLFGEYGIASETFNYLVYVEPILLQDWLSSALTLGSHSPGEFLSTIKTTGQPHKIKIYTTPNDIVYVSVIPAQETYLKTKFASIDPTPIITNCTISDIDKKLQRGLVGTIIVKKNTTIDGCILDVIL